jgi:hypothetical protein
MKFRFKLLVLPFIAFVLISCNLFSPAGPLRSDTPTPDLVQTLTALAPTAIAQISTSTSTPFVAPSPFPTSTATQQPPAPTAIPTTIPVVQITPIYYPTAVPPTAVPPPVAPCNWAQFLGDVTVPDGTVMQPGQGFVKTWRLKNIGTCAWTQGYTLIFSGGSAMSGPANSALPVVVPPGGIVDVSVNLVAPTTPGSYVGYWKLATNYGAQFGIGPTYQGSFYVAIKVPSNPTAIPTVNPTVIPTTTPDMTRITFQSYATSAMVNGNLNANQPKSYVLRALAGQVMMVNVASPYNNVFLRIYGLNTGQILLDYTGGTGQTSWQGTLPVTQDYVIQLFPTGGATNFTLNVTIPETIVYAPGTNSLSLSAPLRPNEAHTYIIRAGQAQTMTLQLTPNDKTILLALYGYQNGQQIPNISDGQTSWVGQVPVSQDYIIKVVSQVGYDTTFTLYTKIQ